MKWLPINISKRGLHKIILTPLRIPLVPLSSMPSVIPWIPLRITLTPLGEPGMCGAKVCDKRIYIIPFYKLLSITIVKLIRRTYLLCLPLWDAVSPFAQSRTHKTFLRKRAENEHQICPCVHQIRKLDSSTSFFYILSPTSNLIRLKEDIVAKILIQKI